MVGSHPPLTGPEAVTTWERECREAANLQGGEAQGGDQEAQEVEEEEHHGERGEGRRSWVGEERRLGIK